MTALIDPPSTLPGGPVPDVPITSYGTLAHRAVLSFRATDFGTIRRATAHWIETKHGAAPLATGAHRLGPRTTLTNQAIYAGDGAETAIRLQLREGTPAGTWRTTLTAAVTGEHDSSCVIALEFFPVTDTPPLPGWPRLIRAVTTQARPVDGLAHLTGAAQLIDRYDAGDLGEILCDPARRKPALVAARPNQPDPYWSRQLARIMPQCAGAASLYLLTDNEAVDALRASIGANHRVAPGAVRCFLPDVDPFSHRDALRHRYIPYARITDRDDHALGALPGRLHRLSACEQLPAGLLDLAFPDAAAAHQQQRREAITMRRDLDELASLRSAVAELTALLDQADEDVKDARAQAREAEQSAARLERRVAEACAQSDQDLEEAIAALDEAERLRAEAHRLRAALRAVGRHAEAYEVAEEPGSPDSFDELRERAHELPGVLLSAHTQPMAQLDEHERARMWTAKAWNALLALNAYAAAAADGFTGGFYQYCTAAAPAGPRWPARQVCMTETEATLTRFGAERLFPAPLQLAPDGRILMQAHLRLDQKGQISPRLYFLDDTKGNTRAVIVGYIGPHLTNLRTT